MSHSYARFHEDVARLSDMPYMVAVKLIANVVRDRTSEDASAAAIAGNLDGEVSYYAPGVMSIRFEDYSEDPEWWKVIVREAVRRTEEYGDAIPVAEMNRLLPLPGTIWGDFATTRVLEALSQIAALFERGDRRDATGR